MFYVQKQLGDIKIQTVSSLGFCALERGTIDASSLGVKTECSCRGQTSALVCVSVVDNSSNWAVCGKSSGVISMPVAARATHRVHMEVMPLFAGYLPLPDVRLFKYLPHHSAHSSQLDAGKDSEMGCARRRRSERRLRAGRGEGGSARRARAS